MLNNTKKILIIEDEDSLRDLITNHLSKEGFRTVAAANGEIGYKKIKEEKPDLILLDIVMPIMDGYQVLEKMYKEKNKTPVIIISNSGQPVEIEKTKRLGAVDHLIKTEFRPQDLMIIIKKHFDSLSGKNKKKYIPHSDVKGPKIVIVEDEKFLRELCASELDKAGFSTFEIIDGTEAVNAIKTIKPDLALLDLLLPDINGFDVLKQIKSDHDKNIANIPILIFSNFNDEERINQAKNLMKN